MSSSNDADEQTKPLVPRTKVPLTPISHTQAPHEKNIIRVHPVTSAIIARVKTLLQKSGKKLITWFVFTVVIGILPIVVSGLLGHFTHQLRNFFDLFVHGELLIIAFALAADAIGDLIYSNKIGDIGDIALLGVCFILFALSALVFASLGVVESTINKQEVGIFSLCVLLATLIVSACCKALVEV